MAVCDIRGESGYMGTIAARTGSTGNVLDLVGRWRLLATTSGYFTFRQRVDWATFYFEPPQGARMAFGVDFQLKDCPRRIRGTISVKRSSHGTYSWRGSGPLFLAARSSWCVAVADDGSVASLYNPGSMMTEPGTLVLRREDLSVVRAKDSVARDFARLGLTRQQYRELVWRA